MRLRFALYFYPHLPPRNRSDPQGMDRKNIQFVNFFAILHTIRKKMHVRIAYVHFFLYFCTRI